MGFFEVCQTVWRRNPDLSYAASKTQRDQVFLFSFSVEGSTRRNSFSFIMLECPNIPRPLDPLEISLRWQILFIWKDYFLCSGNRYVTKTSAISSTYHCAGPISVLSLIWLINMILDMFEMWLKFEMLAT